MYKALQAAMIMLALLIFMLAAACATNVQADISEVVQNGNIGPRTNYSEDPVNGVYVSTNGNDSTAIGTFSSPYKSINKALEAANPGDTVILRGGTYSEGINVRIRKPNITIKSKKGEWAVIDLTTYNAGADEDSGVYFDVDSSGGKLKHVEVKGGFYAVCMETKWDWGDPADRVGASDIIIEDCVLHDSRYDTVKVKPNCNNVTIRYNEIYNSGQAFNGNTPNGEDNAEGIDNVNGNNMVVQNNYIHDICSNAIYAKGGAADALIENNRIERAYGGGILVGFDTSPEYFNLTVNPLYYENIRGIVRNNLIIGTGWEGIGLYASKDAQVYNNTLVNVVNGGLYHSAVYFGLSYQDWEDYAGRPASVNPNIHHNIISQPSGIVRPMVEIRYADELGGMSALDGNPVMNNNCYHIDSKEALFTDRRPKSELPETGLSSWQAHISGDSGSIEVNPVLDDDYIATNSQCEGMGLLSALTFTANYKDLPDSEQFQTPPPTETQGTGTVTTSNPTTFPTEQPSTQPQTINAAKPKIKIHPKGKKVKRKGKLTLRISASVSKGTLSYQWYNNKNKSNKNGRKIKKAVEKSYKVSTKKKGTLYFYCIVTNTDTTAAVKKKATATSKVAKVVVKKR